MQDGAFEGGRYFLPEKDVGVIVFANTGVALGPITRRLFEAAQAARSANDR